MSSCNIDRRYYKRTKVRAMNKTRQIVGESGDVLAAPCPPKSKMVAIISRPDYHSLYSNINLTKLEQDMSIIPWLYCHQT